MRRCYLWVTLLVAGVLGSIGLIGRPVQAAEPDTIVMALERDQDNMDPHMHFQRVGIIMNINMYDSLLHKNPQLERALAGHGLEGPGRHHLGVYLTPGRQISQWRSLDRRRREIFL